MKKWTQGSADIALYLVASGFVLMTVQGSVFRTGAVLTIIGVLVQVAALLLDKDTE
jgi:hypothetical protein